MDQENRKQEVGGQDNVNPELYTVPYYHQFRNQIPGFTGTSLGQDGVLSVIQKQFIDMIQC